MRKIFNLLLKLICMAIDIFFCATILSLVLYFNFRGAAFWQTLLAGTRFESPGFWRMFELSILVFLVVFWTAEFVNGCLNFVPPPSPKKLRERRS
jgi:hypothetical protein